MMLIFIDHSPCVYFLSCDVKYKQNDAVKFTSVSYRVILKFGRPKLTWRNEFLEDLIEKGWKRKR
jgi:hypothetical protein